MIHIKNRLLIVAVAVSSLCCFNPLVSRAEVASPSNATEYTYDMLFDSDGEYIGPDVIDIINDLPVLDNNTDESVSQVQLLKEILTNVEYISGSLASPSSVEVDETEIEENIEMLEDFTASLSRSLPVSYSLPDHDVVRITGTFGGTSYTLLIPKQYYPDLWVSDNGYLYNIGTANIVGRLFLTDSFSATNYNYYTYTLTPLLTTSASTLYRYSAINYRTYYYASTSTTSLSTTVTYGNFIVDEIDNLHSVDIDYMSYYVLLAVLFMEGLVLLCYWKASKP